MERQNQEVTIRTVCGMPDFLRCGLLVDLRDGVIKKVRPTGPDDPTAGRACPKGLTIREMAYHPDRLRYPMKRIGARGEGRWKQVTWDEALDDIAARLLEIREQHGPASVAWMIYVFMELTGLLGAGYSRLMSLTRGTYVDWWGCGDAANPCADLATFGTIIGEAYLYAMSDPKFGMIWGTNQAVTAPPFWPMIKKAKENGCKLAAIDPRFTKTSSYADEHVPIRPGTDAALALGMIHVILNQGLQDEKFITEHTVGPLLVREDSGLLLRESDVIEGGSEERFLVFDQRSGEVKTPDTLGISPALEGIHTVAGIGCRPAYHLLADLVKSYPPEKVSEITDVPLEVIRRLALTYATEKPAIIVRGWGLQRTFHGDLSSRAINTLAAVTGNMNLNLPPMASHDPESFYKPGGPYQTIPLLSLYDAVSKGEPFPIKAVWCAGHNFMTTMPNTNRILGEILPNLELVVVCDLFMTASARQADYVLPVASILEYDDITMFAGLIQLQQKVIEPLYETKSDFQIAAELGRRMGLEHYFDKTEEQYIEEILAACQPLTEGITLEKLRQGPIMIKLPDPPWRLNTPTARVEFYVEKLKQFDQELPIYLEPKESARREKSKKYPLILLSTHPANRVHSTLANVPTLQKIEPEPTLEINPTDAESRNISHGDVVSVFNDRGQLKVRANVTQDIKSGVVNTTEGWWPEQYMEGQVNNLTHDRKNPAQDHIMQANAAFYDVLVEVEKVEI